MFFHQRTYTREWKVPYWLEKAMLCSNTVRIRAASAAIKLPKSVLNADQKCCEWLNKNEGNLAGVYFQQLKDTIDDVRQLLLEHEERENTRREWLLIFDRIDLFFFFGFQIVHITYFWLTFAVHLHSSE